MASSFLCLKRRPYGEENGIFTSGRPVPKGEFGWYFQPSSRAEKSGLIGSGKRGGCLSFKGYPRPREKSRVGAGGFRVNLSSEFLAVFSSFLSESSVWKSIEQECGRYGDGGYKSSHARGVRCVFGRYSGSGHNPMACIGQSGITAHTVANNTTVFKGGGKHKSARTAVLFS